MSLYSRMKELRPLPSPDVYDQAHALADEGFGPGGSWENVTNEFAQIPRDNVLEAELRALSQYGYLLQEKELSDDDENSGSIALVGRAFAQGFSQQVVPSQLIYSNSLTRMQGLTIIHSHYAAQSFFKKPTLNIRDFEDQSEYAKQLKMFNSQYISALGQYGLSKVGSETLTYIAKWAQEAYPMNTRLARAFEFGHGAMILAGFYYQSSLNDQLLKFGEKNVDLDKEVVSILVNSSSEDN